jgi:hypothetical protein
VLGIRDILIRIRMRIRILESVPLTKVSGRGSRKPENIRILRIRSRMRIRGLVKNHKEVTKQKKSRFFLLILLDDGRIRIRIRTCGERNRMQIWEAQKHMDPTDQDADPDPQYCPLVIQCVRSRVLREVLVDCTLYNPQAPVQYNVQ